MSPSQPPPRNTSLRGIRHLALSTGTVALILYVLGQCLSVPSGFGIEDYLGWPDESATGEMQKIWERYGVEWCAASYLFIDTVVFVPLYGALLLALSAKFLLAAARDKAVGNGESAGASLANLSVFFRPEWFAGSVLFLLVIDVIENVNGLSRMKFPELAVLAVVVLALMTVLICLEAANAWLTRLALPPCLRWIEPVKAWIEDFPAYRRSLNTRRVVMFVLVLLIIASILLWKELSLTPGVWAHHVKVGFVAGYLCFFLSLVAAWFFGFFFDTKVAAREQNEAEPVRRGYTRRSAFRRAVVDIVVRSRYVIATLVVFAGLALVMNQGRDVLYSEAAAVRGVGVLQAVFVLCLSALGMWVFGFSCWLWSRSVCLIRSPETPNRENHGDDDPAHLKDRFARDWARFLGLVPAALLVLLCGATLRDAIWANDLVAAIGLALFSVFAVVAGFVFVFQRSRDAETHFYNQCDLDEWQDLIHVKNGRSKSSIGRFRLFGVVPPFWMPFLAAVCMFVSRTIPLWFDDLPPMAIATFLFSLTFWLSLFGWMSLAIQRTAIPWVGMLIIVQ